jgi:4-hydroxy-tetrahydrodipicolinate synthase
LPHREELVARLKSVVVTTVTPFNSAGEVDYAACAAHARFLVEQGIRVLTPCGNTGEFSSLSLEEARRVVATVAEAVEGRAVVMAGIGWSSPIAADLARAASAAGADCVMVHHPVHTFIDRGGLRGYYQRIMDAADLGLVLYKRGPQLSDQLIADLVEEEQVLGVKYAVNDLSAFTELVDSSTADVAWICGTAERWAPFFHLGGAAGFTSGLANFAPGKALELHAALSAGDYAGAMSIRAEISRFEQIRQGRDGGNNVPAVKEAMAQLGLCPAAVRDPLLELDDAGRAAVREVVASWQPRASDLAAGEVGR